MSKIALPITIESYDSGIKSAARAKQLGADLVEFRVDSFFQKSIDTDAVDKTLEQIIRLVENAPLDCIITCRLQEEGGEFKARSLNFNQTVDESARIALLKKLTKANCKPAYIDLELIAWQRESALQSAMKKLLSSGDTKLILSAHDFEKRPANLNQIMEQMAKEKSCQVIKLAWKARSLRDNLEVFEIIKENIKPTIGLCMGEFAFFSRVLAGKFGALLTFASLDEKSTTAPGQPTIKQLKEDYRFNEINKNTKVFAVIGYPVGHSLSPAIHNNGFKQIGFNGVYLPAPIPKEYEHFKATVGSLLDMDNLDFCGASVTIPHKKNLLKFVEQQGGEIEPLAQTIGAANTLMRDGNGKLYASNTDYAAALDSVCDTVNQTRRWLLGKRVAVLGAGGVARAVIAGFLNYGAIVDIYNRTFEKAKFLADEFNSAKAKVLAHKWEQRVSAISNTKYEADIIINCTPIGMSPRSNQTPLEIESKKINCSLPKVIFDTIYNPATTRLLKEAKEAGFTIVQGEQMFVRQAAKQFELWTGKPAPLETFKNIMRKSLQAQD